MGERRAYAPGAFSFVELACSDVTDARAFYAELLGWEAAPPAPAGVTMMRLRGRDVAVLGPAEPGEQPGWISYVTVADADAAAATAEELGGTVRVEPVDVAGAGRTATVADPHGAAVALWEPRGHVGAGLVNEVGAFCWNELSTRDVPAAERFWGELLGWTFRSGGDQFAPGYRVAEVGGRINAGLRPAEGRPPGWLVYFTVESITDACELAMELGGTVLERPQPMYGGTFAVIADRQGSEAALWEGEPDD